MNIQYYRNNWFKYYTYIHKIKYIYVTCICCLSFQVTPSELCKIDFASAIHPERKKTIRRGPVPTRKRQFKRGCDIPKRLITKPDSKLALKKLWDINKTSTVFTAYPKALYKHDSETDTASESECIDENPVPLPLVLTALYRPEFQDKDGKELCELGRTVYPILLLDTDNAHQSVEMITRDQSKSPVWHAYRTGRVTASKVHDILVMKSSTQPDNLVYKYMQWGKDMESIAITKYAQTITAFHQDIKISQSGLVISPKLPYLAASPDGIRHCSCHEKCLIEIKCPYTLKDKDPTKCFGIDSFCIDATGNLKKSHRYYAQVQMQMYVTLIDTCDFVVYTEKDIFITKIEKDSAFIDSMVVKSTKFFFNHLMPELLSRQIQRNLPVPQVKISSVCFCGKAETKRMIICSDMNCSVTSFHYKCVGLSRKPKGAKWFCPVCVRLCNIQMQCDISIN